MAKSEKIQNLLIEILEKKAKGYYYEEVQYEYQKTQNNEKINNKALNINQNLDFFAIIDRGNNNLNQSNDMIKSADTANNNSDSSFILTRKKVTTHYIPPDLQAIKILTEMQTKKENTNSITNLSDEELISLKNQLIKEMLNDNFTNNKTN